MDWLSAVSVRSRRGARIGLRESARLAERLAARLRGDDEAELARATSPATKIALRRFFLDSLAGR